MTSNFDQLFALTASALFVGYLARCVLGGLLLAAARLPGRAGTLCRYWGDAVTPQVARRAAAGLLGTVAVVSVGAPAFAAQAPTPCSWWSSRASRPTGVRSRSNARAGPRAIA